LGNRCDSGDFTRPRAPGVVKLLRAIRPGERAGG
jgi:hypothetical protein